MRVYCTRTSTIQQILAEKEGEAPIRFPKDYYKVKGFLNIKHSMVKGSLCYNVIELGNLWSCLCPTLHFKVNR